jgi:hypothetical protein
MVEKSLRSLRLKISKPTASEIVPERFGHAFALSKLTQRIE